jgi:hypothetical protein
VRGTQQVNYAALDNVGVRLARPVFGGIARGDTLRPCNYALPVPCTNGVGSLRVTTHDLTEGTQGLVVQAQDAASNWGTSRAVTVRVDNTAPGAVPVTVDGGEGWRNRNDFDLTWSNPPEPDRAPISSASYRVCGVGATCFADRRVGAGVDRIDGLVLPAPGDWHLRLWREDAAGNQEPTNASVPVALRYDPNPPELGFEALDPSDPTRISVRVSDALSGLASGQIEISREGSGVWQVLSTRQEGDRLVARVDDARLTPGAYQLRATARDRATNQNTTSQRADGTPMVLTLPLRLPTQVEAGFVTKKRGRPHRTRSTTRIRIRLGGEVKLSGRLLTSKRQPIAGADVVILERHLGSPESTLANLRTDNQGRWVYLFRARSSAILRLMHPGTATTLPSQDEVRLQVPAGSTISVRPRRLFNGQAVKFQGRLQSRPVPTAGKLVELQVVLSGRWQTFRTVRSDARGWWTARYRFRRSCGLTQYRFRARLPSESAYPFEAGRTRPVVVRVRGRPCP